MTESRGSLLVRTAGGFSRPSTPVLRPVSGSPPSPSTRPNSGDSRSNASRPVSAVSVRSRPVSAADSTASDVLSTSRELPAPPRALPNDAIFNTQFTSAGRRFLSKVKKNRAMQVDRRSKGFHAGLEQRTVIIDPITQRHYRVLILDPDLQRREELADDLEHYFEILVAPSNERAFALLGMFKVDFVLVFVGAGNDKSIASSPALAFLREMKKKCFNTPAAALVSPLQPAGSDLLKLLQRALHQGGLCGFFEADLPRDQLVERLSKLLHSLVVAQEELGRSYGKSRVLGANNPDEIAPVHAMKKRSTIARLGQEATAGAHSRKPDSVTYDREGMLLELSLNQRKHCLQQRRAVTEAIAKGPHSVLGVDRALGAPMSSTVGPGSVSPIPSALTTSASPDKRLSIARKIPPLPSQKEVSKLIYAKPHEIQGKIHRHLYERFRLSSASGAIPQDPLLHHCVAIDPRSVLPAANRTSTSTGTAGVDAMINAYFLYQERRFDEAMAQCDRAARTQSGNLLVAKLALLLRGVLLDTRGDFARAEKTFEKCLALDPDMHEALFNLSVSRLKLGKDRAALEAVTAALRLAPGDTRYLQNRALIFRRSGEFAHAQSDYAKLLGGSSSCARGAGAVGQSAPQSPTNAGSPSNRMNKCDVEDGVFDHLFGKPPADKLALVCAPELRSDEMVANIVARLQALLFFQHFSTDALAAVARVIEFDVVACGKAFALAEAHPLNFYVLLGGRLSVRRKMGDFALSTVTTRHLDVGMVFGCSGHAISTHSTLIADECAEIGIVWPGDYADTIHAVSTDKNHEVFLFLQNQVKVFRAFSTSELGHLVGISERRRFRKGDVLLDQNQVPTHFIVLWKGSCAMYQDFSRPPLASDDESASGSDDDDGDGDDESTANDKPASDDGRSLRAQFDKNKAVLPFHRHLAKPDWPLGFQTRARSSKSRKYQHGRRNGLALGSRASTELAADAAYASSAIPLPLVLADSRRTAAKRNARIQTFVAPAIFGESAFLDQQHAMSKWCECLTDGCHGRWQRTNVSHVARPARWWPSRSWKCSCSSTRGCRRWNWRRRWCSKYSPTDQSTWTRPRSSRTR